MPGPEFQSAEPEPGIPQVAVGVLGYGFMGRAHSLGYRRQSDNPWPPAALPRLVAICGRREEKVRAAALRFGYEGYYTDWQELVADPEIVLFDNCTQHFLHAEPSLAALRAGKHVLCEKPLAPTLLESRVLRDAAASSGLVHMVGFNYRFVPAIRLARELIQSGALGDLHLFRGQYLQEFRRDPAMPAMANTFEGRGRGALNGIGCHIIDSARFLMGELDSVFGKVLPHINQRPSLAEPGALVEETEDDTFHAVVEFENGATGVLDGSNIATGRKNQLVLEINGSRGSLRFDLERLNELQVYLLDPEQPSTLGFRDVMVTETVHPLVKNWWPRGHVMGWESLFVEELRHLLACIVEGKQVDPLGATFEDGYRAALISEAMRVSSREGKRIEVHSLE